MSAALVPTDVFKVAMAATLPATPTMLLAIEENKRLSPFSRATFSTFRASSRSSSASVKLVLVEIKFADPLAVYVPSVPRPAPVWVASNSDCKAVSALSLANSLASTSACTAAMAASASDSFWSTSPWTTAMAASASNSFWFTSFWTAVTAVAVVGSNSSASKRRSRAASA